MKLVKIGGIKNIFIVVLTIAAVYQTALLWLENYSGHNFFYSFFSSEYNYNGQDELLTAPIDPKNVIIGYGNKTFSVTYPGIDEGGVIGKTNLFIEEMLKNGSPETVETAFDEYISQKCIILDFSIDVLPSQYFLGFGGIDNEEGYSSLNAINQIIAVPSAGRTEENKLYIVDSDGGKTCAVTLRGSKYAEKLTTAINNAEIANMEKLKYISTKQNGFNIFKENVFVPQWSQSGYQYAAVTPENSIDKFGTNTFAALENATSEFFNGYSAKTTVKDNDGIYSVSTNDIIVKYYPTHVLEYYNYTRSENNTEQNLSSAYYACRRFLKNDKSLNTDVFLTGVEFNSNGLLFRFDYSVNDMPVFFSDSLKKELNMEHAIEIFVEGGAVKRYRRYARDFVLSPSRTKTVSTDFLGAMNTVMAGLETPANEIENLVLGYNAVSEGESVLMWYMSVDGAEYITEASAAE